MPNVVIEAGTVDVTATKLKVDKDDFTNQVSWSNLVTKDNKDGKTGLIDIKSKYPNRADLVAIVHDETERNPLTVMPPFGRNRILTPKEIEAVVDFLQTL